MNRYSNIRILNTPQKKKYYNTVYYSEIPLSENDTYVITTIGDRLDIIAGDYLKDSSLYWIILIANPTLPQDSLYPPVGTQIRIPNNIQEILNSFNQLNK
jgi:hypothetical protein